MFIKSKYFYGNEVSEYGQKHGYLDYLTLSKAFDSVMCNDFLEQTTNAGLGNWEQISGFIDNSEEIEELQSQICDLESSEDEENKDEVEAEIEELNSQIEELENMADQREVFQWFITNQKGAEILQRAEEIVLYNDTLGLYLWGVTHFGTSWDYVLTDIRINTGISNI